MSIEYKRLLAGEYPGSQAPSNEDVGLLRYFIFRSVSLEKTEEFYVRTLGMCVDRTFAVDDTTYLVLSYFNKREQGPRGKEKAVPDTAMYLRFEMDSSKQVGSNFKRAPLTDSKTHLVVYTASIDDIISSIEISDNGSWVYLRPEAVSDIKIAVVVDPNGICIRIIECPSAAYLEEDPKDLAATFGRASQDRGDSDLPGDGSLLGRDRTSSTSMDLLGTPQSLRDLKKTMSSKRINLLSRLKINERNTDSDPSKMANRLGCLVVPCDLSSEVALFYQSHFSAPSVVVEEEDKKPVGETSILQAVKAASQLGSGEQSATNKAAPTLRRTGFQVVDREDFPEVLAAYTWIANGPRSKYAALCLVQQVDRRSSNFHHTSMKRGSTSSTALFKDTRLIGIGFEMKQLYAKISEMEVRGIDFGDTPTKALPGMGEVAYFKDPNSLTVEICDGNQDLRSSTSMSAFEKEVMMAKSRRNRTLTSDKVMVDKFLNLDKERSKRESKGITKSATMKSSRSLIDSGHGGPGDQGGGDEGRSEHLPTLTSTSPSPVVVLSQRTLQDDNGDRDDDYGFSPIAIINSGRDKDKDPTPFPPKSNPPSQKGTPRTTPRPSPKPSPSVTTRVIAS